MDERRRTALNAAAPASTPQTARAPLDAGSRAREAAGPRQLSCYLVEDSPVIRQNLIATLEEMLPLRFIGTAEDEGAAVDWVHETAAGCDLMLIDIVLKTGTGFEVLRQAKAVGSRARLVVLTNFASADIRRRCQQLGADRVFDKSTELDELFAYCSQLAAPPRLQ